MFGHESKPSRIWTFACKEPDYNREVIDEQIYLSHKYRNMLVENELSRRKDSFDVLEELCPDYCAAARTEEAAKMALDELEEAARSENQKNRDKRWSKQKKKEIKELRANLKEARRVLKEVKKTSFARDDVQERLKEVNKKYQEHIKVLRKESGLYWCNYLDTEQNCSRFRTGAPPRFRRFDGQGRVVVQIQNGITIGDVMEGKDTRIRIMPLPESIYKDGQRVRKGKARTTLYLRVGSVGRDPIWAKVPISLHRKIPEDAKIKWIYLNKIRVGLRTKWTLQLVLARDEWEKPEPRTDFSVGIDLGWRATGDGLRLAYWSDENGEEDELVMPPELIARFDQVEDLQSIRDGNFNAMISELLEFFKTIPASMPDWLKEETSHLHQWKSARRLDTLTQLWRENRFHRDEEIFTALTAWRKQDRHLYFWQEDLRAKAIRIRNLLLRCFAKEMASTYRTVVLENCNWAHLMKKPKVEEADEMGPNRRRRARLASPGTLRRFLEEKVAEVVLQDSKHTTKTCSNCGKLCKFDAEMDLDHRCEHCNEKWDQDANAARNLCSAAGGGQAKEAEVAVA